MAFQKSLVGGVIGVARGTPGIVMEHILRLFAAASPIYS